MATSGDDVTQILDRYRSARKSWGSGTKRKRTLSVPNSMAKIPKLRITAKPTDENNKARYSVSTVGDQPKNSVNQPIIAHSHRRDMRESSESTAPSTSSASVQMLQQSQPHSQSAESVIEQAFNHIFVGCRPDHITDLSTPTMECEYSQKA